VAAARASRGFLPPASCDIVHIPEKENMEILPTNSLRVLLIALVAFFCLGATSPIEAHPSGDESKPEWVTQAVSAPGVHFRTFKSRAAGTKVSYHVYVPEAYRRESNRRFPVLYWLHGTGGGLPGIAPVSAYFDNAIRSGKIPPMLVIFPNGLETSMWCNSKDGTVPMETIVVDELIPHIDSTYRTVARREGRLVEGFSMGGQGAARLGLKYPDIFGAVSVLAGGPLDMDFLGPRAQNNMDERNQILESTYGGDIEYYREQNPRTIAEQYATEYQRVILRIVVGDRDHAAPENEDFSEYLTTLSIRHSFREIPGVGHSSMALLLGLEASNWAFYRRVFRESGFAWRR
jgi:enterochelin esterase-like enzyme